MAVSHAIYIVLIFERRGQGGGGWRYGRRYLFHYKRTLKLVVLPRKMVTPGDLSHARHKNNQGGKRDRPTGSWSEIRGMHERKSQHHAVNPPHRASETPPPPFPHQTPQDSKTQPLSAPPSSESPAPGANSQSCAPAALAALAPRRVPRRWPPPPRRACC